MRWGWVVGEWGDFLLYLFFLITFVMYVSVSAILKEMLRGRF